MMGILKSLLMACCFLVMAVAVPAAAEEKQPVDVLLVMAIDASASVSQLVFERQLEGHAAAFRDPLVHNAVQSGYYGKIAVALMLWSNPTDNRLVVPWRVVGGADDALRFADEIDALPRKVGGGSTGLGASLVAGMKQIQRAPFKAARRIMDVSSNGFNNIGVRPELTKPALEFAEIDVNALVIMDEYDWLQGYYTDSVIVGPASFVMPVGDVEDYADAILRKLVRELSYNGKPDNGSNRS